MIAARKAGLAGSAFSVEGVIGSYRRKPTRVSESHALKGVTMLPKPSRLVALIVALALALASCSSIGTINGQRVDVGASPPGTSPAPQEGHLCQDFEWLCIVGVVGLIALIVVVATVHGSNPNTTGANATP
jgi:hypothetical protein